MRLYGFRRKSFGGKGNRYEIQLQTDGGFIADGGYTGLGPAGRMRAKSNAGRTFFGFGQHAAHSVVCAAGTGSSEEAQGNPAQLEQPKPVLVRLASAQRVDTSGIEKVSTAIRQGQEPGWELPGILSFAGGYAFTEKMGSDYTVTRYDLNGNDAAVSLSFEMHFMGPEMLTLSKDKIVCAPSGYSAEKECSVTAVTLLDFAAKQVVKILEEPFAVDAVGFARLNDDDFAFLYRDAQNMQRVMVYDDAAGCSAIYEAPFPQGEENSELLFSICSAEENIYLLVRRTTAGDSQLHCLCIDREGRPLWDRALDLLEKYANPEYSIDQITVCGKYLLIKFYSCGTLPPFAALRLDDDEVRALEVPRQYPCRALAKEPVDGRYLVFTLFPDNRNYTKGSYSSDIAVFDVATGQWTLSKLLDNENGEAAVVCSADGRLIFCDRSAPIRKEWFAADLRDCMAGS